MKVRIKGIENTTISKSTQVYELLKAVLMRQNKLHRQKEYFWAIGLHNNNKIMFIEIVSIGILNQCALDPVEVFNFAVSKKCKRLIIAHNHPSGNLNPSSADIRLTDKLIKGGQLLNIELLDHLIITETSYTSMADCGYNEFISKVSE